jgi:hypothetical protein
MLARLSSGNLRAGAPNEVNDDGANIKTKPSYSPIIIYTP